jgi:long-chain fatty acid transport protein
MVGVIGKQVDLSVTLPQSVTVGLFHEFDRGWAILAEFGWSEWSRFGKADLTVSVPTSATIAYPRRYRDTYHAALGGEYRFAEEWTGSVMFAYESSPVRDEDRTVDFVAGPAYRFGAGVSWKVDRALELGATYEFVWSGDLPVDQYRGVWAGRVSGTYTNTSENLLALTLAWLF